jgi:hypothetical protein
MKRDSMHIFKCSSHSRPRHNNDRQRRCQTTVVAGYNKLTPIFRSSTPHTQYKSAHMLPEILSCLQFLCPQESREKNTTISGFIYKAPTQFKINFNHQFLLINYKLYIKKIIPLKTTIEYESNDIFFIIYILSFYGKKCWSKFTLNYMRAL